MPTSSKPATARRPTSWAGSSRHLRTTRRRRASCGLYTEGMAMPVAELAERLKTEAARRGITPEQLLDELAARLPALTPVPGGSAKRHLAFAGIGASTSGPTAPEADPILAAGFRLS